MTEQRNEALDCWLVRSLGGEGPPGHMLCYSPEEVRHAFAALCFGDPQEAHQDELNAYMEAFNDRDEWEADGTRLTIRFEIDGLEVTLLKANAALQSTPQNAARGRTDDNSDQRQVVKSDARNEPEQTGSPAAAAPASPPSGYWMIERGSPAEWWVRGHRRDDGTYHEEWTQDAFKAQRFNKWGAERHAKELESWGVKGPLRATEHLDCDEPPSGPTPRCDEQQRKRIWEWRGEKFVPLDFARTLERERNALEGALRGEEALTAALQILCNRYESALRSIVGEQQCVDNLMSDKDIARAALSERTGKGEK